MSRLDIWGTDVEISVAAAFLQTDVFVHTQVNPTMSKWLRYQPLTKISLSKYWKIQNKDEAIYLRNACSHFEVVDGGVMICLRNAIIRNHIIKCRPTCTQSNEGIGW